MFGESPGALSAIYVSPTRVAQQTAAPLAERYRPDVVLLQEPPVGAEGEAAVAALMRAVPGASPR